MEGRGLFSAGSVADSYREHLEPVVFGPWAVRLIDFAGLQAGQVVLDVASGTGVVARAAAARVGPAGRVIASDISPQMLAQVKRDLEPGGAPIETLESSATDLKIPDASIDVVLCQQGLPFIPDRAAAAREMRRVLRPGGRAGVAVWLSNPRVEPFIIYGEALQAHGLDEPFPHAYDTSATSMTVNDVEEALQAGGLSEVTVETRERELDWSSPEAAAQGIMGTPYGPVLNRLEAGAQQVVMTDLVDRMTAADGRPARHRQVAIFGRGTAG